MIEESLSNDGSKVKCRDRADGFGKGQPDSTITQSCQVGYEDLLRNAEADAADGIKEASNLCGHVRISLRHL